ncbi:ArsR/SmtB family transcription factor [Roseicyclus sp.]|uniref:ArsR/SmtB family transcription factor n=1 Tax=Roseicyclus sp. TaxID=1914329 RepID=UPI003BB08962|nr:metalloregulator ArsR/SmtB family transcription factor [Pseudomonadota bacterium]
MSSDEDMEDAASILPRIDEQIDEATWRRLRDNAQTASDFLKAISHEGRLMILCSLANGEKSVTEIETMLASRQAAVSQQLSRLRLEGLVTARREGKQIYYSLTDDRARMIIERVYELFCT